MWPGRCHRLYTNTYPHPNSCCPALKSPSVETHSEARDDFLLDPSIDSLWTTCMALGCSWAGGEAEPSSFEAYHIKTALKWHCTILELILVKQTAQGLLPLYGGLDGGDSSESRGRLNLPCGPRWSWPDSSRTSAEAVTVVDS